MAAEQPAPAEPSAAASGASATPATATAAATPAGSAGAAESAGARPAGLRESLADGGRPLLALLVVALLVKLVVVMASAGGNPLAWELTSDRLYYMTRAHGLLGLFDDPLANEPHHLPPLYPRLLSLVPGVAENGTLTVHLLQAVLGTVALALVWVFARARCSRLGALVATGLTLLYGPISFFEAKLLGDSLAFDGLVAALVVADVHARRPRGATAAGLGLLLAGVALLRPQALLLLPVFAVWIARSPGRAGRPAWGATGAFLAAAALVLAPSTAHNAATSGGDLILVSDNGGVNLWIANHREAPVSGTFATHDIRFGDIADQARVAAEIASAEAGRRLSPGEVSSWFTRRALGEIAADPGRFLQRVGRRAAALCESFQTGIVSVPQVERRVIPPLLVLGLPFGVLLGLAVAAWVLGARRSSGRADDGSVDGRVNGPVAHRPPRLPALAVAGMVVLTALLFFHYERFRLPLVPLLATAVGVGVDRWIARGRTPESASRPGLAVVAAAIVIGLSYLPQPHHAPTLANGWTSLGTARLTASADAFLVGRPDRAQQLAQLALDDAGRALAEEPGFVRAELLAARACLSLGQLVACDGFLDAVEVKGPDLAPLLVMRAWLFAQSPDDAPTWSEPEAEALLQRLEAFPPDDPGAPGATAALRSRLGR